MMKRIFYNTDGTVSVMSLAEKELRGRTPKDVFDADMAKIGHLQGLPFEDVEDDALPVRDENRDKWRHREVGGKKQVFVDAKVRLKREIVKDAEDGLDAELKKAKPSVVEVSRLQRDLEKARKLGAK